MYGVGEGMEGCITGIGRDIWRGGRDGGMYDVDGEGMYGVGGRMEGCITWMGEGYMACGEGWRDV